MGQALSNLSNSEMTFNPSIILEVTKRLSKILTEEIALLKDMRIAEIHKFYNDKMELAALLEGYRDILKQNPELLNSIPKRVLDEIRDAALKFELLVEEDNKQITRAKEVHKLVMEAVRKTLEKNTVKSSGYNKKGLIDIGYKGAYITPPVSVNENI